MSTAGPTSATAPPPEPADSYDRALAIYMLFLSLALLPGLLAASGIGTGPGGPLAGLDRWLSDIRFGETPRFWMGVAGATMMALLLLYPVRKYLGIGRLVSVGLWFHLHAVLGLLGPVLVLYHAYFGRGSTPANVALFTLLIVVASGIFGRFAYMRISAAHHRERRSAADHMAAIRTELGRLTPSSLLTSRLSELAAYERLETERHDRSAREHAWTRSRRRMQDQLRRDLLALVEDQGIRDGWSPAQGREAKARLQAVMKQLFRSLARTRRRAALERLAALWRVVHLPLFFVTIVATGIHVAKVWNIDRYPSEIAAPGTAGQPPSSEGGAPIATRRVITRTETVPGASEPQLVRPPAPAQRPRTETPEASPRGAPATSSQPSPGAPPSTPPGPAGGRDPVRELAQATALDNTGTLDPLVVKERLARFKSDPTFDHAKTRFPLVGKHLTNDCAQCHKTTLKDTPRTCISCHKKDDVHRGRRPNCEQCHTPADWTTLIKRE